MAAGQSQNVIIAAAAARHSHGMAFDASRGVCVEFGGTLDPGYQAYTYSNGTSEWDGTSWLAHDPTTYSVVARYSPALAYDFSRRVVVMLGGTSLGGSLGSKTYEWNGQTWTDFGTSAFAARSQAAMAYDGGRSVMVLFGGSVSGGGLDATTWERTGTTWSQVRLFPGQ